MQVVAIESGEAALRRLDAHPEVDLVLMDIVMPALDGDEATKPVDTGQLLAQLRIWPGQGPPA